MDLAHLTPMAADESAALLFITGDQYLFRYREKNGATGYKFVSPAAVRSAFANEIIDSQWLPRHVRRWGIGKDGEWLLVAYPPQRFDLSFVTAEGTLMSLRIPMPGLAFLGYATRYYIWAYKEPDLRPETLLFAAPLPNVDGNGAICFGSNPVLKASAQTMDEMWRLFLTSPFNNHSVNGKSHGHPNDVREQLRMVAQARRRRYSLLDLVPCQITANQAVEGVLRGLR